MTTKTIITIVTASLLFIASLVTNIYYVFDGDSETSIDVSELGAKGQAIYEAIQTDTTVDTTVSE